MASSNLLRRKPLIQIYYSPDNLSLSFTQFFLQIANDLTTAYTMSYSWTCTVIYKCRVVSFFSSISSSQRMPTMCMSLDSILKHINMSWHQVYIKSDHLQCSYHGLYMIKSDAFFTRHSSLIKIHDNSQTGLDMFHDLTVLWNIINYFASSDERESEEIMRWE